MKVKLIIFIKQQLIFFIYIGILGDNDAFLKLNENIEKISTDLKEKLDEKDKIKKDLDDVKNKRKTMFLNFFDQVS